MKDNWIVKEPKKPKLRECYKYKEHIDLEEYLYLTYKNIKDLYLPKLEVVYSLWPQKHVVTAISQWRTDYALDVIKNN